MISLSVLGAGETFTLPQQFHKDREPQEVIVLYLYQLYPVKSKFVPFPKQI